MPGGLENEEIDALRGCGYAYESALISESFQTAVPATLSYVAGLTLLGLLDVSGTDGSRDTVWDAGVITDLAARIVRPSFSDLYFDPAPIDVGWLCQVSPAFSMAVGGYSRKSVF